MSKRVLCVACNKPIKEEDFGVASEKGSYHDSVFCLMKFLEDTDEKEEAVQEK